MIAHLLRIVNLLRRGLFSTAGGGLWEVWELGFLPSFPSFLGTVITKGVFSLGKSLESLESLESRNSLETLENGRNLLCFPQFGNSLPESLESLELSCEMKTIDFSQL